MDSDFEIGPIAAIFWKNEEYSHGLGRDIFLDGVVCLVDAVYGQKVLYSYSLLRFANVFLANGRGPR